MYPSSRYVPDFLRPLLWWIGQHILLHNFPEEYAREIRGLKFAVRVLSAYWFISGITTISLEFVSVIFGKIYDSFEKMQQHVLEGLKVSPYFAIYI